MGEVKNFVRVLWLKNLREQEISADCMKEILIEEIKDKKS